VTFTLPPNNRAPLSPGYITDQNNTANVLSGLGAATSVLNTAFAGGADPTGTAASDAAFLAAFASGADLITIPPGTYLLNGSVLPAMASANTVLRGAGPSATVINIGGSFTPAAAFSADADNCTITDMTIQGASATIAANPQCYGIQVRGRNVNLLNLRFLDVNGYCIKVINLNAAGSHQANHQPHIRNIWMEKCAGGIWLNGDGGDTIGAIMSGIHGNTIGGGTAANLDALRLENVFDVDIQNLASSVGSATSGHSIHLVGHCATVRVTGGDVGGFPVPVTSSGQCAVKIEDVSANHSTQVRFMNIAFQTHDTGVSIDGAAADIRFIGCDITDNNGDGVHLGGTGLDILFRGCKFANNGTAPPAATNVYDVNWTGTSHGQFDGCVFNSNIVAQGSAGVQNTANTTRNRVQFFPNSTFGGTGAAASNWFPANQAPRYVRAIGSSPGLAPRQPAIAASTAAVTNDTGFDCSVYIAGGTVTAVAVGGTAIASITSTPAYVRVPANQTVTLTYSVAPTWQWFGD
jgi:hypothetical protein